MTAEHATPRTHDCICHGTISLMATLDRDTEKDSYACASRHQYDPH